MKDTRFWNRSKIVTGALSFLCIVGNPCADEGQRLGSPGSTWGAIRYPSSEQPEEKQDLVLEGAIEQGLDILSLGENTRLTPFIKLAYKLDTEKLDYNNKLQLAPGIKVRHYLSDSAILDVGVRYEVERRVETGRTWDGPAVFASWFASWAFSCGECAGHDLFARRRFPGRIWGEVRYPGSQVPVEQNDLIAEGAIEQGVDWVEFGEFGTLNTFARVEYTADTARLEYNRSVTFGVGVQLNRRIGSNGLLQIGAQYAHDYRWESDVRNDAVMAFVLWSGWWDARGVRYDVPR